MTPQPQPTGIPDATPRKKRHSVKDVDEFMELARKRYELALADDAEDRAEGESDTDFVGGNQWDKKAEARRKKAKVPILTWNRLQTFVAQIVNDGRENKPSIRTSAMDGGQKHTAEFYQERIRHLEYECDADIAYDTSREQQVVSGRGFYRVSTEYKPGSFEQRLRIDPINNQFSVLFDPAAQRYDRSDSDYCFVFSSLAKDAYERRYGKDTAAAQSDYFADQDNPAPGWVGIGANAEEIQVAEYWLKVWDKRKLCLLEDLTAVYEDEMTGKETSPVMDSREEDVATVMQYVIDGVEPLDETEWIGSLIPVIPVWGKQMIIRKKRRNYSLVRFAKDPQRLVNLYVSNIAGEIARTSKAPYIIAEGQILGREEEWADMNEDPRTVVQYKPKSVDGTLIPPPHREAVEPPIQALTLGLNQAIDAIKAAMGIFDASLGSGPGDTSGIAIQKRQKESDSANFHFPDNEARSRKHLGRILIELIPIIDRGRKEVPTRAVDGKVKLVKVNQAYRDDKTGQMRIHNLGQGTYEPAVSTGPSYNSQRQQANDAYAAIAAADKNFMTIAGDLYFRTSDMPGADEIADRYEKMLPPQLKPPPTQSEQQAAQSAQALQQLSAQHQQQTALIHQLSQIIDEKQVEATSREKVAAMTVWGNVRIAGIKAGNAAAIADSDREADRLEGIFDRAHEHALASIEGGADAAGQQADQQHERNMQTVDQIHEASQQQEAQAHQVSQQASAQGAAADQQQSAQEAAAQAAAQQPAAETK